METPHIAAESAADLRTPDGDGEWVRRPEAAARLGIGERTLDNRLRCGKLQKRWHGSHVEVWVPRPADDVQATKAAALLDHYTRDLAAQLVPLVDKVEALARENGELRQQLRQAEDWQARAERAEAQLAALSAAEVRGSAAVRQCAPWWAALLWWRR